MSKFSLYHRLTEIGSLTEPCGNPDPRYALPSTLNWMRALSIAVSAQDFDFEDASRFYKNVKRASTSEKQENTIFEHLLFSLHQLSCLKAMEKIEPQADVARVAVVAWYYGIYWAAKAMIAAQMGQVQENHAATANAWYAQFPAKKLAMEPFHLSVKTLVKAAADAELDQLRLGCARSNLVVEPISESDAHSALCGYLTGTVSWSRGNKEESLKKSREFKALRVKGEPVTDFRSRAAKLLRDSRLSDSPTCFLNQAFRYRGKANYREGLYLAHGRSVEATIDGFIPDMTKVLSAFLTMASGFCARHLDEKLWVSFVQDLEQKRAFSFSPKQIFE